MFKFLSQMFSGSDKPPEAADPVDYKDFQIIAAPTPADQGWRVAGTITRAGADGETQTHNFIRADTVGDRDAAIEMTLRKARQTIDEQGERLFTPR